MVVCQIQGVHKIVFGNGTRLATTPLTQTFPEFEAFSIEMELVAVSE